MAGTWFVVGNTAGASPCIKTSNVDSAPSWTSQTDNYFGNNVGGANANAIAYNNEVAVIVGTSFVTTTDGSEYNITQSTNTLDVGYCVAWNGTMWVAGGRKNNGEITLSWSTDPLGITWNNATNNPFPGGTCYGIAWSPSQNRWMAVGEGVSNNESICAAKSTDGKNWSPTAFQPFNPEGVSSNGSKGNCVIWSEQDNCWYVGGYSGYAYEMPVPYTIYKADTVNSQWDFVYGDPCLGGECYALTYGRNTFVASGTDSEGNGIVARGSTMISLIVATGLSFTGPIKGIGYNGTYWAVTGLNHNAYTVAITSDFINWTTSTPFATSLNINQQYVGSSNAIAWITWYSPDVSPFFNGTPESLFQGLSSTFASDISRAQSANISTETIVLRALLKAQSSDTTIYIALKGAFPGQTITISAANAVTLYASLSVPVNQRSLPLIVVIPNASNQILVSTSTSGNTVFAVPLTVVATYSFVVTPTCTGYTLGVAGNGNQLFSGPGVITTIPNGYVYNGTGSTITLVFTDTQNNTYSYPVYNYDLTTGTNTVTPHCFLGDAPVLTPSGYKRIDSLRLGDKVATPDGPKTITKIIKQSCTPNKANNPYLIPKGLYNATEDLLISPTHKVMVDGTLIEARCLGLEQIEQTEITYYNLGITGYSSMIVAGVEVESLGETVTMTLPPKYHKALMAKLGKKLDSGPLTIKLGTQNRR